MTDASKKMLQIAKEKFAEIDTSGQDFPCYSSVVSDEDPLPVDLEEAQKYDTILQTFGFCSERDPQRMLQSMSNQLRREGRIFLIEHGRSKYPWLNKLLDQGANDHFRK